MNKFLKEFFTLSVRDVVAIGIGSALFIIIGMISIPALIVPNTSLQLQYAVQALFSMIFGPLVSFLIGFIGHALKDAIQYGNPYWAWVVPSALFGLLVGLLRKRIRFDKEIGDKEIVTFNLVQIGANLLVWGLVAPLADYLFYQEPLDKVFTQGIVSAALNSITVLIAGTLLLVAYSRTQVKSGSLKKD